MARLHSLRMADDAPDKSGPDAPSGVFGNLPSTRPGTRSPRRDGESARQAKRGPAEPRSQTPPPPPPVPPAGPPPGSEREPATATRGSEPRIANVEDLAWAGIAVAAEAATVGVRLASRALEAARKSIERP
jgi:hypothetical protein